MSLTLIRFQRNARSIDRYGSRDGGVSQLVEQDRYGLVLLANLSQ